MRTPVPGQPLVNVSGAPGDWDGALVLTLEGKAYVRIRPERLDALGSLCRAAGPDCVSDPRWWTAHGGAATVVGPGLHFYGDHIQGPADENTVRPITSDEASHLRDEVSAAEWDESGLGDSPLAVRGIHLGGQLAGAAVLREWGGVAADVGILVAPSFGAWDLVGNSRMPSAVTPRGRPASSSGDQPTPTWPRSDSPKASASRRTDRTWPRT